MLRPAAMRALIPLLALLALLPACRPKIGDDCKRAFDCSPRGERQCDLSNSTFDPMLEGECTIENCSLGACPREGICIKVYSSKFLSVACDPDKEDLEFIDDDDPSLGLVDECDPNEVCLPEGLCADEITARTSCRLECKKDADCRSNYRCAEIGSDGVYVAPDPDDPTGYQTAKICIPRN
jgi:hypothetical protein